MLGRKTKTRIILALIAALGVQSLSMLFTSGANAGSLSFTYIRLDRMKSATGTSFRVKFRTSATNGTEGKLAIKLANYYDDTTGADTNKRFTVNTTQTAGINSCDTESGATALPDGNGGSFTVTGDNSFTAGSGGPPVVQPTGKTITITDVGDLSTSTDYCIDITSATAVTTPTTGGQYIASVSTLTAANAVIDTIDVGLRIITDDQIVVSAVVPPSFNLVLNGNTDAFTTLLDPSQPVSTGGRTATITTNAAHGWICWVKDTDRNPGSQGLRSANANKTIATVGTVDGTPSNLSLTGAAEAYVLDVDLTTDAPSGGTVTVAGEYDHTGGGGTIGGGTLSNIYQPIATADGTADGDVITLIERATISAQTPAGNDYTDTLYVVAAGNF